MRKNRIAVGGIVAAAHSDSQRITGLEVAASMNEHRCHAETVNVNAANDVYMRSERDRSSTDAPIARISSAASSAETAWTSIAERSAYADASACMTDWRAVSTGQHRRAS